MAPGSDLAQAEVSRKNQALQQHRGCNAVRFRRLAGARRANTLLVISIDIAIGLGLIRTAIDITVEIAIGSETSC